jgi:hypothetical protein
MPGAQCTRSPVCAGVVQYHTAIHSGGTGNIRHSPRNGLTAYGVLSPETNSSCLRRRRIDGLTRPVARRETFAGLIPATGAMTIRFCLTQQCRSSRPRIAHKLSPALRSFRVHDTVASTASRPAFMTIAIRPSCGTRRRDYSADSRF